MPLPRFTPFIPIANVELAAWQFSRELRGEFNGVFCRFARTMNVFERGPDGMHHLATLPEVLPDPFWPRVKE